MENQERFFKKEDFKSPIVLGFIAIYIFAAVLIFSNEPKNAFPYIGLSIGLLFLCWLIIDLTKKIKIQDIKIKRPWLELIFGLLILIVWDYLPLPQINFGDKWGIGFILKKSIILLGLPFLFLKFRKNSLVSMGFTSRNWKQNLWIGFIVFLALAIPSAFFVGNTGSEILSGKYSAPQVGIGLFSSFIYYFLMSGFSEEFLFRAFIQARVSYLMKSSVSGVLITSLIFGLGHIQYIMQGYPGITISEAFCRAFFLQTFIGIMFGVLWERTRNLIPCVFVHSGVDGLNNLFYIVSKFGI
ncbi:CPBP family intramembrane metalloprotease [candidate division WOR-3 bacterium]|nr:CPBP family intramembrane metalloprotease [candidate division WOR-3 bacterium]MCK4526649.1 CPBP family intramembrane metalloprotease [candidate division WOR-3 bacterium]